MKITNSCHLGLQRKLRASLGNFMRLCFKIKSWKYGSVLELLACMSPRFNGFAVQEEGHTWFSYLLKSSTEEC